MDKSPHEKHHLHCSLALAISKIGDSWSSMILRDLMIFGGNRRFEQLVDGLGISRNILTDRLNNLLELEIVRKIPVEEGAKRMEYKLTRKGWELMPILLGFHQWCERWRNDPDNSALKFIEIETGQEVPPIQIYSKSGKPLNPGDIRAEPRNQRAREYFNELKP